MNTSKEICTLICSLSPQCTLDEIESTLGSFLKLGKDVNSVGNNPQDETPLMIACDKGKINILKYFASIYSTASPDTKLLYTRSLGDCLYPLESDANNQAVHYASIEHIPYLTTILYEQKRKDFCSEYDAFKALIRQKNSHGDTFVMVLCASGDSEGIKKLLTIHSDLQQESNSVDDDISNIFNMVNASGDSAITLTYMSGHFELLRFLLSRPLKLDISHKDVVRLQNALDKTVSIERIIPAHNMEQFKSKQSNIRKCLELIISHLQNQADRAARDLLEREELTKKTQQVNPPEKKRLTKPRKKSLEYSQAKIDSHNDKRNVLLEATAKDIISTPRFITLEDGTVVSERSRIEKVDEGTPILSILQQESRIEELLIERCLPSLGDANHDEIISMMESLCLDPSMLLLSPQSMAMKLSPSQLEAVEAILKKQLVAISHAREIHSRLMNVGDEK